MSTWTGKSEGPIRSSGNASTAPLPFCPTAILVMFLGSLNALANPEHKSRTQIPHPDETPTGTVGIVIEQVNDTGYWEFPSYVMFFSGHPMLFWYFQSYLLKRINQFRIPSGAVDIQISLLFRFQPTQLSSYILQEKYGKYDLHSNIYFLHDQTSQRVKKLTINIRIVGSGIVSSHSNPIVVLLANRFLTSD